VLVFTILILVILVAPLLAARLRMPDLVLLLAAGTVMGPNGLHVLERDTAITLFGSVGLIYIMFLAGLEIDLHRFMNTRRRSLGFGLLTFAIPQGLGTLAGRYVLGFEWQTSLLLASMFASHTLLAYPIASRLGIARGEPVAITVSATIITDTLALLVLAVIADSARGVGLGLGFWIGLAVGMAALLGLTWWGIPKLTRWFFHNVTEAGGAQFLFVLATVCGCAYLSHFAKMEPIVGAFLAGAAFNRLIPEHSTLMNRVVFTGNNLFIPFFLISVGMLVDPAALLASPRTWAVAAVMVVTVVATKYLAAWAAAKCFGYEPDARQVMFGLSVVQAAATLAAVLIGYDLKIFDDAVLNGTIAMIAVTCPLGAWVVDRYGRRLAQAGVVAPAPSAANAQRLLVPVVNPETAKRQLELAFVLRDTALPGAIHALTVVREQDDTEEALVHGEHLMGYCLTQAAATDIPVQPSVRVDANPSDGIVRAVKELHANLVLCGWSASRALGRRVFGTVMGNLLVSCGARLLFCRLVRPLATNRRLLILWPPLAERRSDLVPLLREVRQLARQIGVVVRVHLAGEEPPELRRHLAGGSEGVPLAVLPAASLGAAQARLFEEVGADDLILLLGERRNASLWSPGLDRLPARVADRFPGNSLLVAYPALVEDWEELSLPEIESQDFQGLALCAVDLGGDTPLDAALRGMTAAAFPANPALAEETRRLLTGAAQSFPVPLGTGVVLLHGHSETLPHPALIVGRGKPGWELAGMPEPAGLLLALLSPKNLPPEHHLGWLKHLAGVFYNPALAARIERAASAEEVCAIIREQKRDDPEFGG
jgi:Kef-type K+ transport system membrane component KefB/mannitol/fructose-specific phosphotransferase system IIA component (Ntr-type)/nucleotide-binding universal stress UspA family protein